MMWKNSPFIKCRWGYKILSDNRSDDIFIFERKDTKTHRSIYSVDGEVFFETTKAKAKEIEEFVKSLQKKVLKIYSRKF